MRPTLSLLLPAVIAPLLTAASPTMFFPEHSLAKRVLDQAWGKNAYGGVVGEIPWPEEAVTTLTSTAYVTLTVTRSKTAGAAAPTPAAKVKRSEPEPVKVNSSELSPKEESQWLNHAFALGIFRDGMGCPPIPVGVCFGKELLECKGDKMVVKETCSSACGAKLDSEKLTVSCINKDEIEFPTKFMKQGLRL